VFVMSVFILIVFDVGPRTLFSNRNSSWRMILREQRKKRRFAGVVLNVGLTEHLQRYPVSTNATVGERQIQHLILGKQHTVVARNVTDNSQIVPTAVLYCVTLVPALPVLRLYNSPVTVSRPVRLLEDVRLPLGLVDRCVPKTSGVRLTRVPQFVILETANHVIGPRYRAVSAGRPGNPELAHHQTSNAGLRVGPCSPVATTLVI